MIKYIRGKLDRCFDTCLAFMAENNPLGSSKRLTILSSYFSAIGVCWFSLTTGVPIDPTVLSLSISLITIATGNYLIGKNGEIKNDTSETKPDVIENVNTDEKKEETKDGQG